ncbi:hypothetical protein FRC07_014422, partial [Ceratobasidium sp. 392]
GRTYQTQSSEPVARKRRGRQQTSIPPADEQLSAREETINKTNEDGLSLVVGSNVYVPSYSFPPPEAIGDRLPTAIRSLGSSDVRITRSAYKAMMGGRIPHIQPALSNERITSTRLVADAPYWDVTETKVSDQPFQQTEGLTGGTMELAVVPYNIVGNNSLGLFVDGPLGSGMDLVDEDQDLVNVSRMFVTDDSRSVIDEPPVPDIEELLNLSPRAPQYIVRDEGESINSQHISYRTPKVYDLPVSSDSERERLIRKRSPSAPPTDRPRKEARSKGKGRARRHTVTEEAIKKLVPPSESEKTNDIISWDEEVRRLESSPRYIYDEDIERWHNPFWSSISYNSTNQASKSEPGDNESIEVNAFIYEVHDDYVNNDEQYAEVLLNLRNAHSRASGSADSRAAGPSRPRPREFPKPTVEEVEDGGERSDCSASTQTSKGKGKGKARPKKKKPKSSAKKKRPSLGLNVEELQTTEKKTPSKRHKENDEYHRKKQARVPQGFQTGGYLELVHGQRQNRPGRSDKSDARSEGRSTTLSGRSKRTSASGAKGGNNGPPYNGGSPPTSDDEDSSSSSSSDTAHGNDPDSSTSSDTSSSSSYSDSSSSTSSNSSDNSRQRRRSKRAKRKIKRQEKRIKELEKKVLIQARSGYKAEKPESWDGNEDFNAFELLAFNYDNWCIDTKQSKQEAVRHFSKVLTGKASAWYLANVATSQEEYTMSRIYQDLFEHCFPADFRDKLRKEYERLRQRDMSVQDYFAKLNQLRRRLKGVSDRQHAQRAFDGADQDIQCEWALKGYDADTASFDELKESALDIERALKIRKKYKKPERNDKRERSRSPNRRNDHDRKGGSGNTKSKGPSNNWNKQNDRRDNGRNDKRNNNGGSKDRRTDRSNNWKNRNRDSD